MVGGRTRDGSIDTIFAVVQEMEGKDENVFECGGKNNASKQQQKLKKQHQPASQLTGRRPKNEIWAEVRRPPLEDPS